MIKLLDILKEENKILIPRRSPEERQKNYLIATQKKIQQYIKDGGEGNLSLSNTKITSLPSGLNVGGTLYLRNTKITSLPSGLNVGGGLDLSYTPITSLPSSLNVGGDLDLYNTKITSLPSGLNVGGNLNLSNTPLSKKYSEEEIRQIVDVKGKIYL